MDKHDLALQHAMKALILIQDEIVNRMTTDGDQAPPERLVVLSIAYHNIGVEYEFLKKYQQALNAYKKSVINAETHLSSSNLMTVNMKNVYDKAINKIADVILKAVGRKGSKQKPSIRKETIIEMLYDGMSEDEIIEYLTKAKEKKD
jgi:tetratricopeptide (TPR) repeat protein